MHLDGLRVASRTLDSEPDQQTVGAGEVVGFPRKTSDRTGAGTGRDTRSVGKNRVTRGQKVDL